MNAELTHQLDRPAVDLQDRTTCLKRAVLCLPLVNPSQTRLDFRLAVAFLATRVKHSHGFIVPYLYPATDNDPQLTSKLTDVIVQNYLIHEKTIAPDQTYVGISRGRLYTEQDLTDVQGFARWQCEIIKDHKLNPIVRRGDTLYLWGARYWIDGEPYLNMKCGPDDKLPALSPRILRDYC